MRVFVCVNQVQLLVGNQIEHRTATSADTITATTGILIKGNNRKSISRTKTIRISKNSSKVHYPLRGSIYCTVWRHPVLDANVMRVAIMSAHYGRQLGSKRGETKPCVKVDQICAHCTCLEARA